jgi:hypothetical protein
MGRSWGRLLPYILLGLATVCQFGCVERRYTIRTDPPGALVVVNGQEVGVSPVSASFTYYHDRDITLIRDGYQTMRLRQPMKAPWWDNLATEFFTENMVPVTLRDEREYTYKLVPSALPPTNQLVDRAEALRNEAKTLPPPRNKGFLRFLGFK